VIRTEIFPLHTENALIPRGGNVHIGDIQDDMVDAVYGETHRCEAPSVSTWRLYPISSSAQTGDG
jgi:hypothetical protein